MEKLSEYLQTLLSACGYELHLEPNKTPYMIDGSGTTEVANTPLLGTQISTIVFPLIPPAVKQQLPNQSEVEFVHNHNLGSFSFLVKKSPAGFNVTIRPLLNEDILPQEPAAEEPKPFSSTIRAAVSDLQEPSANGFEQAGDADAAVPTVENFANRNPLGQFNTEYQYAEDNAEVESVQEVSAAKAWFESPSAESFDVPVVDSPAEPVSESVGYNENASFTPAASSPVGSKAQDRMNNLFRRMASIGASDLHLSVSMPPMVRVDGRIAKLECAEGVLTPSLMRELLSSIMPEKNLDEFDECHDTDFAYEIQGLARFRANVFADRKGMGGVFRIIPADILTAEQLGLSRAIMELCDLSKGLVVVTGPTGSGKSTTLCAMVDSINKRREDHIITIEDPIEFTHENQKCLVNQREVGNHTGSFKHALRAALREDPDILLVGEMRDLETISIAIETAETGHLVFGTLHTTTAASTVDRIIDQFPADRQQQIRVMLSESLRGVIAQTLLPKKGGGRVAALEVLIVTPAISNLIREGKTFQIASSMQTGKSHGMVMLNDALMDLVKKGLVEPRDAYIKAVDKPSFESLLKREGIKM